MALLSPEVGSASVTNWIAGASPSPIHVSQWVDVEVASALAQKARARELTPDQRQAAVLHWLTLRSTLFVEIDVGPSDYQFAIRLLEPFDLGLRGGDALHLAIARRRGFETVTLDMRMSEAATVLGIPNLLLRPLN